MKICPPWSSIWVLIRSDLKPDSWTVMKSKSGESCQQLIFIESFYIKSINVKSSHLFFIRTLSFWNCDLLFPIMDIQLRFFHFDFDYDLYSSKYRSYFVTRSLRNKPYNWRWEISRLSEPDSFNFNFLFRFDNLD